LPPTAMVDTLHVAHATLSRLTGRSYAHDGLYGHLLALVVEEGWRSQGIGALLVGQVERWFAEQGAETVVVTSRHLRQAAHRFYKRLGYEDTGIRLVKQLRVPG
jgi:ribosomal protein S18 acetylase RimI-like enzyme